MSANSVDDRYPPAACAPPRTPARSHLDFPHELIIVNTAAHFPHGVWAVTALCLVLLPSSGQTRARATARILATAAGAVAATALAVVLPGLACFALTAVFAILTVAYALMPESSDAHVLHVASLTATVILLYGGTSPSMSGDGADTTEVR